MDESWLRQEIFPRFSRVLARDEIYLANHSLGRPPDRMAEDVRAALDAWYRDMDGAWKLWLDGRRQAPDHPEDQRRPGASRGAQLVQQ